ncbi:MAG: glycosyltransferase family 39 protein [Chitinophagales bacterium]|nr:glycosyltransferase family 39 protein [Chitinophagales bacterium]
MVLSDKYSNQFRKLPHVLIWIIIFFGITLRLIIFFQNRNLIIDEANIVRNIYESDFAELLRPLKYEQYAPPIFLWIEELLSLTFGYGEHALKLYPMFCGIAVLFVFWQIMKKLVDEKTIWLPLALMAFSPYFIEFSATIKQYMPDVLIVLMLIWLALEWDIFKRGRTEFIYFWIVAGVISIFSSMPSVFALTAIGLYYAWQVVKAKKWNLIGGLILIGIIWLAVFGIYYWHTLKPQINSDYLQNYHADYFLYAIPENIEEWKHNWKKIEEIVSNTGGYTFFNLIASFFFIGSGFIALRRKHFDILILAFTPILLTLITAAMHHYSLLVRVSLFILPLLLILFSYGFHHLWKTKFLTVKITMIAIGIVMISSFNDFELFSEKYGFHEITEGLDYIKAKNVDGESLFIHDSSVPTYIYYTDIHPQRDKYNSLLGAHLMKWDSDYANETKKVTDTVYFIYTGGFPKLEEEKRKAQIEQNLKQVDYFKKYTTFVYGYAPKK